MRKVYPNDSGKWVLDHLYRDMEMVHAVLKLNEQNKLIFNEKLVVMLDPKTFEVLNYIDTSSFLEMFQNFESEDKVMVGKEEAFENLEQHLLIKHTMYMIMLNRNMYFVVSLTAIIVWMRSQEK